MRRARGPGALLGLAMLVAMPAGVAALDSAARSPGAGSGALAIELPSLPVELPTPTIVPSLPPLPSLPPQPTLPLPTVIPSLPVPSVLPSLPVPSPLPSLPLPTDGASLPPPTASAEPPSPSPLASATATLVPAGPAGPALPTAGPSSAPEIPAVAIESPFDAIVLPGILAGIPVFVLLLILSVQVAGGAAWVPIVRRWVNGGVTPWGDGP